MWKFGPKKLVPTIVVYRVEYTVSRALRQGCTPSGGCTPSRDDQRDDSLDNTCWYRIKAVMDVIGSAPYNSSY